MPAGCLGGSHWQWREKACLQRLAPGGQGHGLEGGVEVRGVQRSLRGPVPFSPESVLGRPAWCPVPVGQGWAWGFVAGAWGQDGSQTLTLVFLVFFLRIHPKEHFKEKYAMDDVQYSDEVSRGRPSSLSSSGLPVIPLLCMPSPPTATPGWTSQGACHLPTTSPSGVPSFERASWKHVPQSF